MFRFLKSPLRPRSKFSLENLAYLHDTLVRNPVVNAGNRELIIETLRQTAEVLVWGDQHNPLFFEFFLEKNTLHYFLRILHQTTASSVQIQIIQTLSILIENITAETSIFYLLSNNHINELITHKYDFSDDELLAYYISLLKSLSLRLNQATVQFFFDTHSRDFPLYTEAVKFFNHRESMIRNAVRTLTLNVYRVPDSAIQRYILDKAAAPYFSNLVWYIRDQCSTLEGLLRRAGAAGQPPHGREHFENFVAELLDDFYYLQDIFNMQNLELSKVLADQLLQFLLLPQFVGSIVSPPDPVEDRVSPFLALFLLVHVFLIFRYPPLVNAVAAALVHPDPAQFGASSLGVRDRRLRKSWSSSDLRGKSPHETNPRLLHLLSLLGGGDADERLVLVLVSFLYALQRNPSVDQSLLEVSGLYTFRNCKTRRLLAALTDGVPPPRRDTTATAASGASATPRSLAVRAARPRGHSRTHSDVVTGASSTGSAAGGCHPAAGTTPEPRPLLVDALLRILSTPGAHLVVTLQLVLRFLRDLVHVDADPPCDDLSPAQVRALEAAHAAAVAGVRRIMQVGPLREIFLEVVDQETRSFRPLDCDALAEDACALLLPPPGAPAPAAAVAVARRPLVSRPPSGDAERMRAAVLAFLVLREGYCAVLGRHDPFQPLVDDPPLPRIAPGDVYGAGAAAPAPEDDFACALVQETPRQPGSPRRDRRAAVARRRLVVDGGALIVLSPEHSKRDASAATVARVLPLEHLALELDPEPGGCVLALTSHRELWSTTFRFESAELAAAALDRIRDAVRLVRGNKIRQFESFLDLGAEHGAAAPAPALRGVIAAPVDAAAAASAAPQDARASAPLAGAAALRVSEAPPTDPARADDAQPAPAASRAAPASATAPAVSAVSPPASAPPPVVNLLPPRPRAWSGLPIPSAPAPLFSWASASDPNVSWRRTMEDAVLCLPAFRAGGGAAEASSSSSSSSVSAPAASLFGVFDGHNGTRCAEFVRDTLPATLSSALAERARDASPSSASGDAMQAALTEAFARVDAEFLGAHPADESGCTAIVACICAGGEPGLPARLYAANVGDSRCVLCRTGRAAALSRDHKASSPGERERLAGRVFVVAGRVAGVLAVSRAFGDRDLKEWVISEPEVMVADLRPGDSPLILACDGVFDVMSNQEAVDCVRRFSSAQEMADGLVREAIARGSRDNVSVVVVCNPSAVAGAADTPASEPFRARSASGSLPLHVGKAADDPLHARGVSSARADGAVPPRAEAGAAGATGPAPADSVGTAPSTAEDARRGRDRPTDGAPATPAPVSSTSPSSPSCALPLPTASPRTADAPCPPVPPPAVAAACSPPEPRPTPVRALSLSLPLYYVTLKGRKPPSPLRPGPRPAAAADSPAAVAVGVGAVSANAVVHYYAAVKAVAAANNMDRGAGG